MWYLVYRNFYGTVVQESFLGSQYALDKLFEYKKLGYKIISLTYRGKLMQFEI